MNTQKVVLGTAAGFAGLFGLGLLIYVLIAPDLTFVVEGQEGLRRDYFPGIIIFEILYALLAVLIIGHWAGVKSFGEGLKIGAIVGLLLGLCTSLWVYSTSTMYEGGIIWWYAITFAIRFAVAGGLIGWVFGRE
ncbi:MAG: hypothetical protein OEQ53_19505 [Saprospiraceae bacterium]|nr:hypothetical protein [Saprospiraceae bacterium]